ncbi:MAG: four helix bundle protein [Planctomycetes bacterium]|nr:four helix bundle protein [Planctomycetota bacterium]
MATPIESFRDLLVWQKSMDVADKMLETTDEILSLRKYWLVDQLQRASASIPANIAEGHSGGHTPKQFLKGLYIARGSLAETLTYLELAARREYIPKVTAREMWKQLQEVGRLLNGLLRSIARKLPTKKKKPNP